MHRGSALTRTAGAPVIGPGIQQRCASGGARNGPVSATDEPRNTSNACANIRSSRLGARRSCSSASRLSVTLAGTRRTRIRTRTRGRAFSSGNSTRQRASDRSGVLRSVVEFGSVGAAGVGTCSVMRSRHRRGGQGRCAIERSGDPAAECVWRCPERPAVGRITNTNKSDEQR